jgi:hypothetical protein
MGCAAAIQSHAAVFIGRSISEEHVQLGPEAGKLAGWNWQTIMQVRERFSGKIGSQVIIFTHAPPPSQTLPDGTVVGFGDSGALSFEPDQDYLVFADEEQGRLYATKCNGTSPAQNVPETIENLRHLPAPGTATVRGKVQEDRPNLDMDAYDTVLLPGISITVSGPVQRTTLSGSDGMFRFENLPPGDYKISAALPALYSPVTPLKAELVEQACANVTFATRVSGRIAGRLLDPQGNPVTGHTVELERADEDPSKRWSSFDTMTSTDENGNFHFDSLGSDRYVLGVNLRFPQENLAGTGIIYPRVYYPGVPDRSIATVIQLSTAQHLEDLRLVLPQPLAQDILSQPLTVHWPDGRPAAGVQVSVADQRWPDHHFGDTGWTTDASGHLILKLRSGETYEIFVDISTGRGEQFCGRAVTVTTDDQSGALIPLNFVLNQNVGNCSM